MYVDFTSKSLTVTLAKPVFTKANVQRGVVATDINLTALTEFMRALKVSENGVDSIMENNRSLVATSSKAPLFADIVPGALQTRLSANQSDNALIRQSYAQLHSSATARTANVRGVDIARHWFDGDGGRVHMSAASQRDAAGLDWTMVVAIARSDYMGNVRRTIFEDVAIGLLAVLLALAVGLWLMHRLTSDVQRVVEGHSIAGTRAVAGSALRKPQRRAGHHRPRG